MATSQGQFVWYELLTTNTAAAKAFYGDVVGWRTQGAPPPNDAYAMFMAGDGPVGGLMDLPAEARAMGAPPHWLGYVEVNDVDATARKVESLGGSIYVQPRDIPNVGRFAVLADPQRASFALFKPGSPMPGEPPPPDAAGRVGWHELYATDWDKAFAFYSGLFGWQKADAMDMGAMGTYQIFSIDGRPVGGMLNKPPSMPATFWLYYFNVPSIDAAVDRVNAGGGQIINGPMQVPGGSWIVQGMDPQGVMFALVGRRN